MSNIRRTIPSGRYTDLSLIDHDDSDIEQSPSLPIIHDEDGDDIEDDIFSTYNDEAFNHDDIDEEEYDYDYSLDDIRIGDSFDGIDDLYDDSYDDRDF